MSFKFVALQPKVATRVETYVNEDLAYHAVLDVDPNIDPRQIVVEVWTNQRDSLNTDGEWHAIGLTYRGFRSDQMKVYANRSLMAGQGEFEFNYRARASGDDDWTWYRSYDGINSRGMVHGPRTSDKFSPTLSGPDYNRVVGIVSVGNLVAAGRAKELGFTHVLCTAVELDRPFPEDNGVVFGKVAIQYGAEKPVGQEELDSAVNWIRMSWKDDHRILVYCKYGFQRAGSVVLAFVLAQNPRMSYEEGLARTTIKRLVIPHAGLKDTIYKLYQRSS